MPIQNMEEMIQAGLDRAVELMSLAAWTSFRFNDRNTIKIVNVTGEEELSPVAEYCFSLGDMSPLGARDGRHLAQLLKEPSALMLIGDKRQGTQTRCKPAGQDDSLHTPPLWTYHYEKKQDSYCTDKKIFYHNLDVYPAFRALI